ncbi:MAG: hypothetical protein WDN30_14090 [Pararobbsia sp.]
MQPIKLTTFGGIVPKVPAALLQGSSATIAQNCDLAYGELRSTNDGDLISTFANDAQAIYTEDGLEFFSWPTDVDAVRSPIAQDPHNRLYYTTGTDFRVTTRDQLQINGGEPAASNRVGVPAPTVAPIVTAVAAADPTTSTFTMQFFYELNGTKFQEQTVPITPVTPGSIWSFVVPSMQVGTPAAAVIGIELIGKDASGTQDFDIFNSSSSFTGTLNNTSDWIATLAQGANASTFTVTLTPSASQGANQETVAIVYTYVNVYNEEGPPSPPVTITHEIGLDLSVTVTADKWSADYVELNEIRIYRTATGSTIASFFFAGSVFPASAGPGPTYVFDDTTKGTNLGEEISSINNFPPTPTMIGIMSLPNGILCARLDNAISFANAFQPWAWNPANELTFPNQIVNALAIGAGLVLSTTAQPYVVSGVTPDAMSASKLNITQAGVSKWSIANVGGQVMYATHEGIMLINGVLGDLSLSEQFFTRELWRSSYQNGFAHMRFAEWDGRLIVYSDNASFIPFMLRFDDNSMSELPQFTAACGFVSPITDGFYYVQGANVLEFNGGTPLTATWQSRETVLQGTGNFGAYAALVVGDWTMTILTDDEDGNLVERYTNQLTTGYTVNKLPAGFRSRRWQLKLQGTGRFREFRLADTVRALALV